MDKSITQHYIPRSYLKNFSWQVNGGHFVHVKTREKDSFDANIKKICAENYLYTLPGVAQETKNVIEKFYADNVDKYFPEITSILTNDNISIIDDITRKKIISVTLSLFFRTPKFLKSYERPIKQLFHYYRNFNRNNPDIKIYEIFGKSYNLELVSLDKIEAEIIAREKVKALLNHFQNYSSIVQHKINDAIYVTKIMDDSEFITCDNPVIVSNSKTDFPSLYDENNIFKLPLTPKYLLCIAPSNAGFITNKFQRMKSDFMRVLTINFDIEKYSEQFLIGSNNSLVNHFTDQAKHFDPTLENLQMIENEKTRLKMIEELTMLWEKESMGSPQVIEKLKYMKNHELFRTDVQFMDTLDKFKEVGIEID